MKHLRVALAMALVLFLGSTLAVNVNRETVKLRVVQPPVVNVAEIEFSRLSGELASGEISIGDPTLKTTKSWCYPEGSKNPIKDAAEYTTYYYEIPYAVDSGALVVRDGTGRAVYTDRLPSFDSYRRFGYDECRYMGEAKLEDAFAGKLISIERAIEREVAESFVLAAQRSLDDGLFFNVLEEKVPLYRFKSREHDYADLNEAFELAESGYTRGADGESDLWRAVEIWEAALAESELNDKGARINRKVSVKLYQSVGIALLALGDYTAAVRNMEKSLRYSSMITSRSNGTGTQDLIQRARERRFRNGKNPDLPTDPVELDRLISAVERYRGQIPVRVLPTSELARLRTEHASTAIGGAVAAHVEQLNEQQPAIDAGTENRYERQVGRTAAQGFYLFLMPYGNKLESFPDEVCELTHLNQLRMPKHGFDTVPEAIGNLTALKFLDLSGNRIERLPDSVGKLTQLKTLKLKDNPLAPGELERLKTLLPGCKIKG